MEPGRVRFCRRNPPPIHFRLVADLSICVDHNTGKCIRRSCVIPWNHGATCIECVEPASHEAKIILGLWRLYGIRGQHYEGQDLVAPGLGSAEHRPGQRLSENEIHNFVKLLATADRKWLRECAAVRSGEEALPLPRAAPKLTWKGLSGTKYRNANGIRRVDCGATMKAKL
jgi:hypothetical protein